MSLRPALIALLAALVAVPLAGAQSNPTIGTSDADHSGNFAPGVGADYDFTLTVRPAEADSSVRVAFRYVSTVQPVTQVYYGIGRSTDPDSNPENLVGVLAGNSNQIEVVLSDPDEVYHIRVSVHDNTVDGQTYKTRLEVKASRPSSSVASSPAILYDYTFCYTTGSDCSTGTHSPTPTTTTTSTTSSTTSTTSSTTSSTSTSASQSSTPPPTNDPVTLSDSSTTSSSTSSSTSSTTSSSSPPPTNPPSGENPSPSSGTAIPTPTEETQALPADAVSALVAIPDSLGGVALSWDARDDLGIDSFLVFRLSSPVLAGIVSFKDLGKDGRFHFYDRDLPEGTHHYVVQPRLAGDVSTVYKGGDDPTASNGVRRAYILDLGCTANETDTDGDGLCDRLEAQLGTNPLKADSDGDGLTDAQELRGLLAKDRVPSDPLSSDTNGDGIDDFASIQKGINPSSVEATAVKSGVGLVVWILAAVILAAIVGVMLALRRRGPPKA